MSPLRARKNCLWRVLPTNIPTRISARTKIFTVRFTMISTKATKTYPNTKTARAGSRKPYLSTREPPASWQNGSTAATPL